MNAVKHIKKTHMRILEEIIWIHTPKCRDCAEYNAVIKKCRLDICRYPSKR